MVEKKIDFGNSRTNEPRLDTSILILLVDEIFPSRVSINFARFVRCSTKQISIQMDQDFKWKPFSELHLSIDV